MKSANNSSFSSWSVINDNVIIKHTDFSVFERHGSAIDIRTRWFWNIEHLAQPCKHPLVLQFQGVKYGAEIELDHTGRTRIYWDLELRELFKRQPHSENNYPDLRFERIGTDSYIVSFINSNTIIAEEQDNLESIIEDHSHAIEGKKLQIYTTKYERHPLNRRLAILLHGTKCMACGFDFEAVYGTLGKDFIEVHHTKPLFSMQDEEPVNPETDLICLCSNCHRMIHRKKNAILTLDQLKEKIKN